MLRNVGMKFNSNSNNKKTQTNECSEIKSKKKKKNTDFCCIKTMGRFFVVVRRSFQRCWFGFLFYFFLYFLILSQGIQQYSVYNIVVLNFEKEKDLWVEMEKKNVKKIYQQQK